VSRTFHGRDVFAPAAAHAASGLERSRFGAAVSDPVRAPLPRARREGACLVGEILGADHFGNLATSIREEDLAALDGPGPLNASLGDIDLGPLKEAYGQGAPGRPAAILGSSGRLEIFVLAGSAAASGIPRGAAVRIGRGSALRGGLGAARPASGAPPGGSARASRG